MCANQHELHTDPQKGEVVKHEGSLLLNSYLQGCKGTDPIPTVRGSWPRVNEASSWELACKLCSPGPPINGLLHKQAMTFHSSHQLHHEHSTRVIPEQSNFATGTALPGHCATDN